MRGALQGHREREEEEERDRNAAGSSRERLVLVGDFKAFVSAVKRKKAKVKPNLCFGLLFWFFFLCV